MAPVPPSPTPSRKMSAAAIGGAAATIITWSLSLFHIDVPGAVGAAFGTVCAFAAGYFTNEP